MATMMTMVVNAQHMRHGGRGMGPDQSKHSFARLDLTEAQSEELTALRTEHYKSMKPLRAKMIENKARERTLLSEEAVDLKAVDKLIDQQTELMSKMHKQQTRHQIDMKKILNDEQVMKLEQRKRQAKHMGHGRMGRGERSRTGFGKI